MPVLPDMPILPRFPLILVLIVEECNSLDLMSKMLRIGNRCVGNNLKNTKK